MMSDMFVDFKSVLNGHDTEVENDMGAKQQ